MKIFKNREELYDRLWKDYQEHKRKEANGNKSVRHSFIYRYHKSKKTQLANALAEDVNSFREYRSRSRQDKYVLLCAARQLTEKGELDENTYREIFRKAASTEKLGRSFWELFDSDIRQAYNELTYRLICGTVQDMFREKLGYRQPKYKKSTDKYELDKPEAVPQQFAAPPSDRKNVYTDDIDVMYRYAGYIRDTDLFIGPSAALTEERIELGERLYDYLQSDEERSGVFIPLYIDPLSGGAVYIIGDAVLGIPDSRECRVYTMFFLDFAEADKKHIMNAAGKRTRLSLEHRLKGFSTVREAFDSFRKTVEDPENGNAFLGYTLYNTTLSPLGLKNAVGEVFDIYIDSPASLAERRKEESESLMMLRKEKESRKTRGVNTYSTSTEEPGK